MVSFVLARADNCRSACQLGHHREHRAPSTPESHAPQTRDKASAFALIWRSIEAWHPCAWIVADFAFLTRHSLLLHRFDDLHRLWRTGHGSSLGFEGNARQQHQATHS
jgi:hypothetical protein